jgi:chorismate-pyruvate lyase
MSTIRFSTLIAGLVAAGMLLAVPRVSGAGGPAWPDTLTARLEALAVLQTLNAQLLSHDSATLTLDQWCETHNLASTAHIVAEPVHGAEKPPPPEVLRLLQVSGADSVRHRHVKLRCGEHVLSEADNWYLPGRLEPEMNRVLETTDTAFGRVVQSLHFQRHTLSAQLLWSPLPVGWERGGVVRGSPGRLEIPAQVLEHRALLTLPDGKPLSVVVETYTGEVLAFPAPVLTEQQGPGGR